MSWYEEWRQSPAGYLCLYRVHEQTGHVVAYGPEKDNTNLYIASHYDKHPADHKDAVHIEHLAADSTRAYLNRALQDWADEQDAQYARDSAQRQATETGLTPPEE